MTLAWPHSPSVQADHAVSPAGQVAPGQWAEVVNPFGRALIAGIDLNRVMSDDPSAGAEALANFISETNADIADKVEAGATGIVYRLIGACAEHCTPMQFGGFYLEEERALLADVTLPTLVFVEGADIYFEFVSDLPGTYMGWDVALNQLTLDEARAYRPGPYALRAEGAELRIVSDAA